MIEKATAKRSAGRPYEDVPTPALGEGAFIRVRCISARHKDEYEVGFWTHTDGSGKPVYSAIGARGRLLSRACEWLDTGEPFFDSEEDAHTFRADIADLLFDAAQRISGLNATVEELKKALGAAQAGASRTT